MKSAALFSIILVVFSYLNPQNEVSQSKKWRMMKQVITTEDKKGTATQERNKDFTLFDDLNFDSDTKMTISSYGESTVCTYTLKDGILTFRSEKEPNRQMELKVQKSTKDSLILKRTEIWGNDNALKITLVMHMVPYWK